MPSRRCTLALRVGGGWDPRPPRVPTLIQRPPATPADAGFLPAAEHEEEALDLRHRHQRLQPPGHQIHRRGRRSVMAHTPCQGTQAHTPSDPWTTIGDPRGNTFEFTCKPEVCFGIGWELDHTVCFTVLL